MKRNQVQIIQTQDNNGQVKSRATDQPRKEERNNDRISSYACVSGCILFVPGGGIPVTHHISKCWILTILCHSYNVTHLPFKGIAKVRVGNA